MKRGTPRHPKVDELATLLKKPRYAAIGLLEMLWHFTSEFALQGDVGRFSDDAIAKALCWDGASTMLVSALVNSHWLDACPCHRLRVHDWPTHSDQTVFRVLTSRNQQFLKCYDDASIILAPSKLPIPIPIPLPIPIPDESGFSPESKMALDYLNQKTGSRFRETEANLKRIAARLKEPDITLEGVKKMIERQCALWGGTQMSQYLRPSTLFNTEKFNEYYAAKDQPTSFKPTNPASAPDKPLPTIADLRAKRQQQSQML